MPIFDHLFVILLAFVIPVAGVVSFRRLQRRAADGESINRNQLYLNTTLIQWSLFSIAMIGWAFSSRPWLALGLSLDLDRSFAIGAILVLAAIAFLIYQVRQVTVADQPELKKLHRSLQSVSLMLPRNGNELGRFYVVSVTAGIVEEILWRGFMFWYLSQFMPLWVAAIVSAVGFGVAHAYQGWKQVPPVILIGAALGGLYILTGSLWLPMILHAAIDILQGRMAYEVLRRYDSNDRDVDDADGLLTT